MTTPESKPKPESLITKDDAELRERVTSSKCPACDDSDAIDYESVEVDGGTAYQRADCGRCGLTWWEHYRMTDVCYADPERDDWETWRDVREETEALKLAREIVAGADAPASSMPTPAQWSAVVAQARKAVTAAKEGR